MWLLCEMGGLALAGLLIFFLVIDIAIIRVGQIREKPECQRKTGEQEQSAEGNGFGGMS